MSNVKNALTRKLGPLPAWLWAIIAGVGLYWYRNRNGAGESAITQATTPSVSDSSPAGSATPITLQPGESAFDPGTGQLVTAPSGASNDTSTPSALPITDDPNVGIYDPNTHTFFPANPVSSNDTAPDTQNPESPVAASRAPRNLTAIQRAGRAVTTGKIGPVNRARLKRVGYSDREIDFHLKHKTPLPSKPLKHTPTKSAGKVKAPKKASERARSKPTVKHPTPRPRSTPSPRARTRPNPTPSRNSARPKPTNPVNRPAVRQRPAPAHTTPRKKAKKK